MKYNVLIAFLLILSSCQNREELDADTILLSKYFDEKFGYSVDNDSVAFILAATNGCSSCLDEIFNKVKADCLNSNVHVIVSGKSVLKHSLNRYKSAFWVDSTNHVDKLLYHKGNAAIIWFYKKKVSSIISIEPAQVKYLLQPLSRANAMCQG